MFHLYLLSLRTSNAIQVIKKFTWNQEYLAYHIYYKRWNKTNHVEHENEVIWMKVCEGKTGWEWADFETYSKPPPPFDIYVFQFT
jgi:hypothetical protein